MNTELLRFLWVALLAIPAPAQTTWIVDRNNGPGTHFTDLPPAVQAAAAGDIIRLRPTPVGQVYEAAVIDKPLSILGDPFLPPACIGVFEVRGIPAGQTFVLRSIKLGTEETSNRSRIRRGIIAQDNAGVVAIDTLFYGWDPAWSVTGGSDPRGILIERCALVTISRSMIWSSGARTTVRDSTFIATSSQFRESTPYLPLFPPPETMYIERSKAWLVDCMVRGTNASTQVGYQYGKDAVQICDSTLHVGGFSQLIGGQYLGGGVAWGIWIGNQAVGCWPPAGAPRPILYLDPRSTVSGTPGPTYTVEHNQPVPAVTWTTNPFQTPLGILHYTTASSFCLLAAGPLLPSPLAGPLGTLFLDPAGLFVLDVGFATAQGVRSTILAVPASVALPTNWPIQAVELTPAGSLLLSQAVIAGVY